MLYYALMSAACVFLLAGGYLFYTTYAFVGGAEIIPGAVVEIKTMRAQSGGKGRPGLVQRPLIEYRLQGGKHQFVPKVGSYKSGFTVGQQVEILYNPSSAKKVALRSFQTTWLFPIILCGMGVLLIGVSFLLQRLMGDSSRK